MSITAMVAVRDYSQQKGSRLLLLLMIADALNDDENSARCAIGTLADRSRLDRRNCHRYLNDLIATGELVVTERAGKTNLYYIPMLPDEAGYGPQPCDGSGHACNGNHTPLDIDRARITPRSTRAKADRISTRRNMRGGTATTPTGGTGTTPVQGGGKYTTPGVVNTPLQGWYPDHSRGGTGTTQSLIDPFSYPNVDPNARDTPPISGNLAEAEAEPEQDPPPPLAAPPPPAAPAHDEPETTEQRALWRAVQQRMLAKLPAGQKHNFSTCHLYQEAPALFELKLPAGADLGMFRSRYESLIHDALCAETERGLVALEIWK